MPEAVTPERRRERRDVVVADRWGQQELVVRALWVVVGANAVVALQSS